MHIQADPKFEELLKKFPWLLAIRKDILKLGRPTIVKVQRLETESLNRFVGKRYTIDDSYFIFGYIFDEHGKCLGSISPKESLLGKIKNFLKISGRSWSLRESVENRQDRDKIHYIVLYGHSLRHYLEYQFYLYKLPVGKTMSELIGLDNTHHQQEKELRIKKARIQLNNELKEIKS